MIKYFALLLLLTTYTPEPEPIFISKTASGYEIHSPNGSLLLEFTDINTDSLSLETLEYIYQTSKEFRELQQDKATIRKL